MTNVFGWWMALPKGPTLVNRETEQVVRFLGEVPPGDAPTPEIWLRFEYEDDEIRFPVLARMTTESFSPITGQGIRTGPRLHVDYHYSAGQWQKQTDNPNSYPPYGVWRRVDDCFTDALACWPAVPPLVMPIDEFVVRGGWLNGKWCKELVRTFPMLSEADRKRAEGEEQLVADRPELVSLEAMPQSVWHFHGLGEGDDQSTTRSISSRVRVSGLTKTFQFDSPIAVWVVPHGTALTGLDGRTVYMRTEDGRRLLYPISASHKDQERGGKAFHLEYINDDFHALMNAHNRGLGRSTNWRIVLSNVLGGRRNPEEGNEFWIECRNTSPQGPVANAPSFPLWNRLRQDLMDAWLFWEGTEARCDLWSDELALVGAESVTIGRNYLGGIWPAGNFWTAALSKV